MLVIHGQGPCPWPPRICIIPAYLQRRACTSTSSWRGRKTASFLVLFWFMGALDGLDDYRDWGVMTTPLFARLRGYNSNGQLQWHTSIPLHGCNRSTPPCLVCMCIYWNFAAPSSSCLVLSRSRSLPVGDLVCAAQDIEIKIAPPRTRPLPPHRAEPQATPPGLQ